MDLGDGPRNTARSRSRRAGEESMLRRPFKHTRSAASPWFTVILKSSVVIVPRINELFLGWLPQRFLCHGGKRMALCQALLFQCMQAATPETRAFAHDLFSSQSLSPSVSGRNAWCVLNG